MKLLVLITADVEQGLDVALAWDAANAPGITVIRTRSLYSIEQSLTMGEIELPRVLVSMAAAMAGIIDEVDENGLMLLSLMEDELISRMVEETNRVLGDLTQPHHGVLFVVPIERAIGVMRHDRS